MVACVALGDEDFPEQFERGDAVGACRVGVGEHIQHRSELGAVKHLQELDHLGGVAAGAEDGQGAHRRGRWPRAPLAQQPGHSGRPEQQRQGDAQH